MGAAQSVNYPEEQSSDAVINNLPIIDFRNNPMRTISGSETATSMSNGLKKDLATKKIIVNSHFKQLQQKLDTALKLHLLFDNYETKNSVIITDLDKKLTKQQKELKDLKESNDKIRQLIDYDKGNIQVTTNQKKIVKTANIILSLSLLIVILLNLNKKGLLDPILNKLKPQPS